MSQFELIKMAAQQSCHCATQGKEENDAQVLDQMSEVVELH